MDSNGILEEILEMARSGELPATVSNRVLLAGIIKNAAKSDKNAESISTLAAEESRNKERIDSLDKLMKFLSALVVALLGWTVFG